MEVVKVQTEEGKERYYVSDNAGLPVESVMKFVKFKDNIGYAKNTLKSYCQHLKLYFEYLEQQDVKYQKITIDDMGLFVNWLQNPYKSLKILPFKPVESARQPETINKIVDSVIQFYDYTLRYEEGENTISEKLRKIITTPGRTYKSFLYGIADNKKITSNILKIRARKNKPKIVTKEEIETLINNCNNYRDKFLLFLLFETGIRIGEALSLWVEDCDIGNLVIELKDRGELENNAEIKTVSSPRKLDISQNLLDVLMEYLSIYHTEKVKTNHILIKISGKNANKPMNYVDVNNLFRLLTNKTGIYITPHMLRHSSLTVLRMAGWEPELLKIRAGHKNIYTTLNTYIHPSDTEITKEFEKTKETLALISKEGDQE